MWYRKFGLAAALLTLSLPLFAGPRDEHTYWGAWFGSTGLGDGWSITSDVQLRSSSDGDGLRNTLLRAGLTRALDARNALTGGYAWIGTHDNPGADLAEHRIWQQYVHGAAFGRAALTHRLRLEQRFVEPSPGAARGFSQRLRYFARAVEPLQGEGPFQAGPFLALQNETFLTLQQASYTNGRLFDQNRAYVALGWRFERRFDVELGYLNQFVERRGRDTMAHVVQLAFYTRLP
jgi:hypothetical protein